MKAMLKEGAGLSNGLLCTLAVIAGVSVANLYYNQPLLDMLRQDLGTTTLAANHVALFSQLGYALGLLFIIPLADLFSRRRIVLVNFLLLAVSLLAIATASDIRVIHGFSLVTGVCSVIPQIFIPLAAQYSRPEYKNRNVGIVLSGLLTGILASRVVSGVVGELFGWREMYFAAAGLMVVSAAVVLYVLPDARPNFRGTYAALMKSLLTIVRRYPTLRLYSVRAALAFGSFLCFWASLAFKMAQAPFYAGSNVVGMLGLCGIAGALAASEPQPVPSQRTFGDRRGAGGFDRQTAATRHAGVRRRGRRRRERRGRSAFRARRGPDAAGRADEAGGGVRRRVRSRKGGERLE